MKSEALGEQMTVIRHKSGLTAYICQKPLASAYAIFGTRYGKRYLSSNAEREIERSMRGKFQ